MKDVLRSKDGRFQMAGVPLHVQGLGVISHVNAYHIFSAYYTKGYKRRLGKSHNTTTSLFIRSDALDIRGQSTS